MSVYVDSMKPCVPTNYWRYNKSCHLVADSVPELHRFADQLGLKKSWFQEKSSPHYDLTEGMRAKAVELGAIELSIIEFVKVIQRNRSRG
ncbi:MAG: DUF4031 domain-containing protein [Planctomycetes bacterium]|nr:DUF4031 domain-containing protein [Planctomycetota bacterium]